MKLNKELANRWASAKSLAWLRLPSWRGIRRWAAKSMVQSGRLTTLLALIGIWFIRIENPNWLLFIQAKTFDIYQQILPRPAHADTPVVIVDIDEKSIAELGQWPWPRTVLAQLVDRFAEYQVKVAGFDVVFAESDRTSPRAIAASATGLDEETRKRIAGAKDNDEVFAESIKANGRIVLGQPILAEPKVYPEDRPTTSFVAVGGDPNPHLQQYTAILRNINVLDQAAAGHGVFSVSPNFFDGIVRSSPAIVRVDAVRYPSLALEMLRVGLGARSINIKAAPDGIQDILMRPKGTKEYYQVSTDRNAEVRVYYTPHEKYKNNYISAVDVINRRIDPARLADKFVLVGTSAQGLLDLRASPLDQVLPGVEVHANILENVIYKDGLTRLPQAEGFEVLALLLLGLTVIVVTPWAGARIGIITFLLASGVMVWWSWNSFVDRHELYDPVLAIAVAFLFYSFLTYVAFSNEESQKKQIRGAFGQYLSPAVVEQLANDPSQLKLGGENRNMSYMFSDIRGFTTISELFDAEGLTKLINRLLTPLTDVILTRQGTIDKYMGDCVMAFWNAPLPVEDHERQACRATFEMVDAVNKLNVVLEQEAKVEKREHRPLAVGIGVNTGVACVGNMGSTQRFGYSVLGDPVNLASRLEGQSKAYGTTIVIGESTAAKVQDFAVLELDLIKVKGKTEAVRIFTLLGDEAYAKTPKFQELKQLHDKTLAAYRAQNWDEAESTMAAARHLCLGEAGLMHQFAHFYEIYAERVAEFREDPPGPDWDNVYVATSK